MKEKLAIVCLLFLLPFSLLNAQNTLTLADGESGPEAEIQQVAWLEGHWKAEALGGTAEEYWSAPAGNAMMGMFRLLRDGQIVFYEIFTITEESGSLLLRIKHFHPDLKGWEEKDDTVDFPLVKVSEEGVWFDGLTMLKADSDTLMVYVRSESQDGAISELEFPYRRVD
ncbi:DUF6265 family protein [Rhodohalobacter mucosus]|uniref:DUF6265 domain-containing protein n=1 Tax=Rhodohalobacter mucosus TaxID=2079485 RepID=A0A316TTL8_9BACT|nr:DUF6265 family protein [Rhodohalobacter mucosus]PWN07947.1 hypothetical protein DDZ15_02750 [Rhodohalobacter mucosus]